MPTRRYGRLPRAFDPAIPHASALRMRAMAPATPIPIKLDYSEVLPVDLGVMRNDVLGCCTSSGLGHAVQVWSRFAEGAEVTVPDGAIDLFYRETTGWDGTPGDATDRGAIEQEVLKAALNVGFPLDARGDQRTRLSAFVELDPRHPGDVCRAVYEAGVAYLGFNLPRSVVDGEPPEVWDADAPSGEGHCVIAVGYDQTRSTFKIISWGRRYELTFACLTANADEAYALVSPLWVEKTGLTPLNVPLAELEAQMGSLRASASS